MAKKDDRCDGAAGYQLVAAIRTEPATRTRGLKTASLHILGAN